MTVRRIARTSHALAVAARSGGADRGVANPTCRTAMRAFAGAVPLSAARLTDAQMTGIAPENRGARIKPVIDRFTRCAQTSVEPGRRNVVAVRHGFAAMTRAELFQVVKTG